MGLKDEFPGLSFGLPKGANCSFWGVEKGAPKIPPVLRSELHVWQVFLVGQKLGGSKGLSSKQRDPMVSSSKAVLNLSKRSSSLEQNMTIPFSVIQTIKQFSKKLQLQNIQLPLNSIKNNIFCSPVIFNAAPL